MQLPSETKDSFDCLAASSLFWDVLPVQTRRPDRDDALEQLSFRFLLGNSGHLNSMRAIRIYIFSEADFHELYTLDITEVDFQTLKSDQGILVDFSKFAEKVVNLLRKCIDATREELPKFKAVLDFYNGEWLLKLVETNDFKQIPHITLAFRRGNSHAVHCFLALRATELKLDRDRLEGNLTQEQRELGKARKMVAEYFEKLQMIESIHTEKKLVYAGQIKDLQVSTHCELVKQREDLVFAYERDAAKLHAQYTDEIQKLRTLLKQKDAEIAVLRDENSCQCNEVLRLQHASGEHERQLAELENEVSAAHMHLDETVRDKGVQDQELKDMTSMYRNTQDKILELQGMASQYQLLSQNARSELQNVEAKNVELLDANWKHEIRMAELAEEILEGNDIVEQLTRELSTVHVKLKRKQSRILQQDEKLAFMMAEIQAASAQSEDSAKQVTKLRAENDTVREHQSKLQMKLKECKVQLESNEQLIRWLNSQVNEVQMRPHLHESMADD